MWQHDTPGVGASSLGFEPQGDGTYRVTETGLGNGQGTATTTGRELTYRFRWSGGEGFIVARFDAACTAATGYMRFTAGRTGRIDGTTLTRPGGPRPPPNPPPPTGPPRGCADLSGVWQLDTPGVGASSLGFERQADGTYRVTETGLGNGQGTATTTNRELTYRFRWSGGEGFIVAQLDAACTAATGYLQFTAGRTGRIDGTRLTRSPR